MTGDIDTAIDNLTDYIRTELGIKIQRDDTVIKTCGTCAFKKESRSGPCLNCGPFNNWEPEEEKPTDWGDDSCGHLLK